MSTLHVLYAPRAEGCPRLALDLIDQERAQSGDKSHVAFLVDHPADLTEEFESRCESSHALDWRPRGFLRLYFQMRKLLKETRPSGIVCYTLGHHVPISVAAKKYGIPVVLHIGNAPPSDDSSRRKIGMLMKLGAGSVKMHIACSDAIASECREAYQLENIESVPNGIDISRFSSLRDSRSNLTNAESTNRKLGMIANLAPHKDHTILIEAMAVLKRRGDDANLILAGGGSERERLQKLATELDVMDSIDWLGNVDDVGEVLQSLDLFVFATTRSEGLGIALVEAMAAGVPIVASDVPACHEVLEGGRLGRLVEKRDADSWADALAYNPNLPIPPIEALSRYDIRQTWRAYAKALGT